MSDIAEARKKLEDAERAFREAKAAKKRAQWEVDRLIAGPLPDEPGYYVDADGSPAWLGEDGTWTDGWGNAAGDSLYAWTPQLPLRRLIPVVD